MYRKSKDVTMHKVFPRNTRQSNRIVFTTDNYEGPLYTRSPYFVGSKLGNQLPQEIIDITDLYTYKPRLKRLNKTYVDLLP